MWNKQDLISTSFHFPNHKNAKKVVEKEKLMLNLSCVAHKADQGERKRWVGIAEHFPNPAFVADSNKNK